MINIFYRYFTSTILMLLLITVNNFCAQEDIPSAPNPSKLFNNLSNSFPNFINNNDAVVLENKLMDFAKSTSNQIVVLIVDTLNGYEPWDYATRIGEKWKIGQEKEDNGIVLLIKPTGGSGERKTFISTGRGLEGAIPDVICRKIVNHELIPNFKMGQFYKGINAALDVVMALAKSEYSHEDYTENIENEVPWWIVVIFFIIFILVGFLSKRGNSSTIGGPTFRSSSSFGSSSSSSFGGFSGGSFGGGGAGGSW